MLVDYLPARAAGLTVVCLTRDRKLHKTVRPFRDRFEDRGPFGADREAIHSVFHVDARVNRTVAAQKCRSHREFRIRAVCILPRFVRPLQQLLVIDQNRITSPMLPDSLPLLIAHQPELSLSGSISAPCTVNRKNGGPISN